jgi:cell division protein FtsL
MTRVSVSVAAIAGALLFTTALGIVWTKHRARTLFIELQSLNSQRDQFNIEWSQLKLEQSAWATPGRVEQLARGDLRMTTPKPTDVKMVQQ